MARRCLALLSGGLDSILAIRIMQEQGIEVEALNFKTLFTCCQDQSGQAARQLGVPLTVVPQGDDYLDLIRQPRFGYGKGANPCVDCRIYMFQRAKALMSEVGADFLISGEVAGQRPMSQKRRDLEAISYHSDLDDLLLRPLSAKLLPPTLPEREGWVDRERLYSFSGRGRKGLIRLAHELGIHDIPSPSTGCALTEVQFGAKVHDLVRHQPEGTSWDFELLKYGRHFRFDPQTKVVVGRKEVENDHLEYLFQRADSGGTAMLVPQNFPGPRGLMTGPPTDAAVAYAIGLVYRYGKPEISTDPQLELHQRVGEDTTSTRRVAVCADPEADEAATIAKRAARKRRVIYRDRH